MTSDAYNDMLLIPLCNGGLVKLKHNEDASLNFTIVSSGPTWWDRLKSLRHRAVYYGVEEAQFEQRHATRVASFLLRGIEPTEEERELAADVAREDE